MKVFSIWTCFYIRQVSYIAHAKQLTCRPFGEIEAVGVVNLRTARSLTGDHLSSVPAAETLVLALFGHHRLVLPFAMAPPL